MNSTWNWNSTFFFRREGRLAFLASLRLSCLTLQAHSLQRLSHLIPFRWKHANNFSVKQREHFLLTGVAAVSMTNSWCMEVAVVFPTRVFRFSF
jgi:hypothetical protein